MLLLLLSLLLLLRLSMLFIVFGVIDFVDIVAVSEWPILQHSRVETKRMERKMIALK